jgi:hypothetical protein
MKARLHGLVGFLATAIIFLFFVSSIVVELMGDEEAIKMVKQLIVYGLAVLIPAMIATSISGQAVVGARQGALIKTKQRRMIIVAANGLVILLPCAILLNRWAAASVFDTTFYLIQTVELLAGGANLILMGLNIRDGLLLAGRMRKQRKLNLQS